jgi:hypothetical protein
MVALAGTTLTQVAVTLAGAWYPEPQRWRWEGVITADEPLVGIVLCEQPGMVQWADALHGRAAQSREHVMRGRSCGPRGRRGR